MHLKTIALKKLIKVLKRLIKIFLAQKKKILYKL